MERPDHGATTPCSERRAAPVFDAVWTALGVIGAFTALASPEMYGDDQTALALADAGLATAFGFSAAYGFETASMCRKLRKASAAREATSAEAREVKWVTQVRRSEWPTETVVQPPWQEDAVDKKPPPDGAGGFRFGAEVSQAEKVCVGSGFEFNEEPNLADEGLQHWRCSGQFVRGEAATYLTFCGNKGLCEVVFMARPAANDTKLWEHAFRDYRRAISERFGSPILSHYEVPPVCTSATAFLVCLGQGKAEARLEWRWKTGHRIRLQMASAEKIDMLSLSTPAIIASFQAPLAFALREVPSLPSTIDPPAAGVGSGLGGASGVEEGGPAASPQ